MLVLHRFEGSRSVTPERGISPPATTDKVTVDRKRVVGGNTLYKSYNNLTEISSDDVFLESDLHKGTRSDSSDFTNQSDQSLGIKERENFKDTDYTTIDNNNTTSKNNQFTRVIEKTSETNPSNLIISNPTTNSINPCTSRPDTDTLASQKNSEIRHQAHKSTPQKPALNIDNSDTTNTNNQLGNDIKTELVHDNINVKETTNIESDNFVVADIGQTVVVDFQEIKEDEIDNYNLVKSAVVKDESTGAIPKRKPVINTISDPPQPIDKDNSGPPSGNSEFHNRAELKGLREFAAQYLAENAQLNPAVIDANDSSLPLPDIASDEEGEMAPTIRRNSGGYTSYVFISNDEAGSVHSSAASGGEPDSRVTVNHKVRIKIIILDLKRVMIYTIYIHKIIFSSSLN